jgi:hypothetical protein
MPAETQTAPLTPYLQKFYEDVLALRKEVEEKTEGLTETQWHWTPSRDRWSLAQILDHLNKVGYDIMPHLEEGLAELKRRNARSDGPYRYSALERFILRVLSPNPPFKIPVPPIWVPATPQNPAATVLPDFLRLQNNLLALLEAANGYDLGAIKVTSPINRFVRLRFSAYTESTVTHEQYHLVQIRALLTHPDFPITES